MLRSIWFALLALSIVVITSGVQADDTKEVKEPKKEAKKEEKKASKVDPKGAFSKTEGDFELTFTFQKGNKLGFVIKNTDSGDGMKMVSTYKIDKDGMMEMVVDSAEKIGEFPYVPEKGTKYGFKVAMKGKTLVMSDLTGEAQAKATVEGEYTPKTEK